MDYTTLASVKQYLGIDVGNVASDALLSKLIIAVSRAVEAFLGRSLGTATYAAVMDGNGAALLPLPQYPITAVSSIVMDGITLRASTAFNDGGYTFDSKYVYFSGGSGRFTKGIRNVSINYTAGYVSSPADVEQAVCETVALGFKQKDNVGWVSKSLAGETITLDKSVMTKSAMDTLNPYRKVIPL